MHGLLGGRSQEVHELAQAAHAGEGELRLEAFAQTPADLRRVEHVVGGHLERLGLQDELVISWTEADR
jgi:hypothetical protein